MKCRRTFGCACQAVFDQRALVRREIVGDDADLFATRLVRNDVGEESDELGRRMPGRSLAERLARLGVEGRVQGQRAVAKILNPVPLGAPYAVRTSALFIANFDDSLPHYFHKV